MQISQHVVFCSLAPVMPLGLWLVCVWTYNALLMATTMKKSLLNFNGVHQGLLSLLRNSIVETL